MASYRRYERTAQKCAVKLEHRNIGEMMVETQDVSATGILVKSRDLATKVAVGDALRARLPSDSTDRSSLRLTVVRLTEDGAALSYE